jgi:hypothetical protein
VSLAVTAAGSSVEVMAMSSTGVLWHNVLNAKGVWQGWTQPGQLPGGAESIAAAGLTEGDAGFMAISYNGLVYHNIRSADGTWQGWKTPVQPLAGWYSSDDDPTVSAAADYNGDVQFVIWDLNVLSGITDLFHTIRYADGQWQSGGWLGPWMPPGRCAGSVAIPTFNPDDTNLHLDTYCYSGAG